MVADGITTEVITGIDDNQWNTSLMEFHDGSLYQSTAYGYLFWGKRNCTPIAVSKENHPVAMALVRRLPVPLVQLYYLRWGPAWRRKDSENDITVFETAIDQLVAQFAGRPTQSIRIIPAIYQHEEWAAQAIACLKKKGFKKTSDKIDAAYHTIFLPLGESLDEVYKGTDRQWRQRMRKAEEFDFTVTVGNGPEVLEKVMVIYREMLARKKFEPFVEIERFMELQEHLPDPARLQIVLTEFEGKPVAFTMASVCCGSAVLLFAGTAGEALRTNAAYITWWKMIEYLHKDRNVRLLDLGGINKQRNPGVYQFKKKLVGKRGHIVTGIGTFEKHGGVVSAFILRMLSMLRQARILLFWIKERAAVKVKKK